MVLIVNSVPPPGLELSPCLCRASPRPFVYLYCSLCSDQGDILQLEILGSGHHCGNAHPHCTEEGEQSDIVGSHHPSIESL